MQKLVEELTDVKAQKMADFATGLTFGFEQFEKVRYTVQCSFFTSRVL